MNTENNKIIAEFMGANPFREYVDKDIFSYEMYGIIESIEDGEDEQHFFLPEQMLFSSDWNWLMEVVEKIESLDFNFNITSGDATALKNHGAIYQTLIYKIDGTKKIDAVYNTCVEFIKWHNEQK